MSETTTWREILQRAAPAWHDGYYDAATRDECARMIRDNAGPSEWAAVLARLAPDARVMLAYDNWLHLAAYGYDRATGARA